MIIIAIIVIIIIAYITGNKQYEHYNLMGKNVNKGLAALGATPMFEYGEGE